MIMSVDYEKNFFVLCERIKHKRSVAFNDYIENTDVPQHAKYKAVFKAMDDLLSLCESLQ